MRGGKHHPESDSSHHFPPVEADLGEGGSRTSRALWDIDGQQGTSRGTNQRVKSQRGGGVSLRDAEPAGAYLLVGVGAPEDMSIVLFVVSATGFG